MPHPHVALPPRTPSGPGPKAADAFADPDAWILGGNTQARDIALRRPTLT
jgi:hypothetical protein